MLEKKLVPKLRFAEFEEINYSPIKFGSVINNSGYGPRFNGNDYDKFGNVKTIRGTDISLDGEIKYNQVPIASLDETFIKNHILKDGDLVMITTADCGLTGVFREQNISYIPSAYAVKISLKEIASPIYFKYFFQTTIAKNQINKFIRKATVANLPGSDIPKLKINFPSLPEQQKIASFLTEVDTKLSQLTKKKAILENYKKVVMQQIFSQQLRFKDGNGNDYGDWEEKSLKQLLKSYKLGGNYSNSDKITDRPLIKMGNLGRGNIITYKVQYIYDTEVVDENDIIKKGDLFFNTRNTLDLVGKVAIWKNELPLAYYNSNLMRLGFNNNYFMNYRLNSNEGIKGLKRYATGTTSVAAIYTKDFLKLKLLVPCTEEQNKIANFLSDLDAKIEVLSTSIENTQTFKKGLLQQLFV